MISLGSPVAYQNRKWTVVHIIPAHDLPTDHETAIDLGVAKYLAPPGRNRPQLCGPSLWTWKRWKQDQYILCSDPNDRWVSSITRARLEDLVDYLPPPPEPRKGKKKK